MSIRVVYEDDWLLIADKPTGLLVIPTPKKESRTLTTILNTELEDKGLPYRLHPCHRIDRETSGLIIYAKGRACQKKMLDALKQKKVKKKYIAFIHGVLARGQGRINIPIEGKNSITDYKVIKRMRDFSIVEVTPLTGRTNQIRIHFRAIGHPLVGEAKFAFRKDYKLKAKRVCLHAQLLEFTHPVTGRIISVNCALAPDMEEFLKKHPV